LPRIWSEVALQILNGYQGFIDDAAFSEMSTGINQTSNLLSSKKHPHSNDFVSDSMYTAESADGELSTFDVKAVCPASSVVRQWIDTYHAVAGRLVAAYSV